MAELDMFMFRNQRLTLARNGVFYILWFEVLPFVGISSRWYVSVWIAPEINRAFILGTNSHDDHTTEMTDNVMRSLISLDQNN
jgi:hypothetical protein